jgi:hypothetical protein
MKNLILTLLLFIAFSSNVSATAQMPDLLIYEGKTVSIFSNPLEMYFDKQHPRPNKLLESTCTASWRGYLATWEIRDGLLYLIKLVEGNCSDNAAEIPLEKLFPQQKSPIKASWFSGVLKIPQGEELEYVHMGYGSIYAKELHLIIKNGTLVETKIIDNTKKPLPSVNEQTLDELQKLKTWEERVKP